MQERGEKYEKILMKARTGKMIVSNKIDRSIDRSIIKLIQFRVCKLIKNYVTMMINENNALFFNLNLCVKKNGVKMLLVTT